MLPQQERVRLHSRLWSCSEIEQGMQHMTKIKEELPEDALEGYLKET